MTCCSSPRLFAEALHRKLGLAADLDHAKIPNLANLYPEAMQLPHDPAQILRALFLGAPPASAIAATW